MLCVSDSQYPDERTGATISAMLTRCGEGGSLDSPGAEDVAGGRGGGNDGRLRQGDQSRRAPARGRLLMAAAIGVLGLAALLVKIGPEPFAATLRGLRQVSQDAIAAFTQPTERPSADVRDGSQPRPAAYDALADMPEDLRVALLEDEATTGQEFRFLPMMGPVEICSEANDAGLVNGGWREVAPGAYECMSDLVPVPGTRLVMQDSAHLLDGIEGVEAPEARGSTLFFVARGRKGSIDTIRFKLNLEDSSVDREGRAMLLAMIDRLTAPLAWAAPEALRYAVEKHGRLAAEERGVRFQVHPEDSPVERVNVVLTLAEPARPLPTGRFAPR